MKKYKVPKYAKDAARTALAFNKSVSPYKKVGTKSGLRMASKLINSEYISKDTAIKISGFYKRFRHQKTERVEQALNLWGGRRFGRELSKKLLTK